MNNITNIKNISIPYSDNKENIHDKFDSIYPIFESVIIIKTDEKIELHKPSCSQTNIDTTLFLILKNEFLNTAPKLFFQDNKEKLKELSQEQAIEIAKLCAKKSAYYTAKHLEYFEIKNEIALFEIAKICASQSSKATAKFFKKFNVVHQLDIIEIIDICVVNGAWRGPEHFKNYGLKNEKKAIQYAKIYAEKNPNQTAFNIKDFRIEDQAALFEIAKICLEKNCFIFHLPNFNIFYEEDRLILAHICAQQQPNQTILNFKYFHLKDESYIFKIAEVCAEKNASLTAQFFELFGFKDSNLIMQIVNICIEKDPSGVIKHFHHFEILDQSFLFDFAIQTAESHPKETAKYFKEFGILNEEATILIAKTCAINDPKKTLIYFTNFEITQEKAIEELVTYYANYYPEITSKYFTYLNLSDKPIYKLAKILANTNLRLVLKNVESFHFKNLNEIKQLIQICVKKDHRYIAQKFENFVFYLELEKENVNLLVNYFKRFGKNFTIDSIYLKKSYKLLLQTAKELFPNLEYDFYIELIQKMDPYYQRQNFDWIAQTFFILNTLTLEQQQWIKENKFIDFLLSYPVSPYRLPLALQLSLMDENIQKKFNELKGCVSTKIENKNGPWLRLILALLISSGKNEIKLLSFCKELKTKKFVDQKTYLSLISTLLMLSEQKEIDFELMLDTLCKNSNFLINEIQSLEMMLNLNYALKIREILSNTTTVFESFTHLFQQIIKEIVPIKNIENLHEKLKKTFGSCRLPNAIFTYAGQLSKLKKNTAINYFAKFIESVLNENFKETRNSLDNNPHLKTIFKSNLELQNQWTTALDKISITIIKNNKNETLDVIETEDAYDLLLCGTEVGSCMRVDGNPRYNKSMLGLLMDGKNRLIAVKDSKGKILARAILRILLYNDQPILFIEKRYPQSLSSDCEKAILKMAALKSKKLKIPLFQGETSEDLRRVNIQALGGPAPYEYVDASSLGVINDGFFSILLASEVFYEKDF